MWPWNRGFPARGRACSTAKGKPEGWHARRAFAQSRGFTLFTALISFLLIALAMLLVQGMIRAESNTMDILEDVREQAEMEAVADLARADALQVFNYGLRYRLESYLLSPGVYYPLYESAVFPGNWQQIQDGFAEEYFGADGVSTGFASTLSSHLTTTLVSYPHFGTYHMDVDMAGVPELTAAIKNLVDGSYTAGSGGFLELVNCPNGDFDNCTGSFYVNLDTSAMSDADYEMLPMITVSTLWTSPGTATSYDVTGRTLQKPVLQRGNIRIYMPLRIFKAIAGANEIAKELDSGMIHNTIKGMCDSSDSWLKSASSGSPEAKVEDKIDSIAGGWSASGGMDVDVGAVIIIASTRLRVSGCGGCTDGGSGSAAAGSDCYEVTRIEAKIPFTEHKAEYMVNDGHAAMPSTQIYTVKVTETFNSGP